MRVISVSGEQLQENKAVYKIVTGIWILCGLAWLTMLFHMAVHFVKLVTNKVDAATHHTNTTEGDHQVRFMCHFSLAVVILGK